MLCLVCKVKSFAPCGHFPFIPVCVGSVKFKKSRKKKLRAKFKLCSLRSLSYKYPTVKNISFLTAHTFFAVATNLEGQLGIQNTLSVRFTHHSYYGWSIFGPLIIIMGYWIRNLIYLHLFLQSIFFFISVSILNSSFHITFILRFRIFSKQKIISFFLREIISLLFIANKYCG